MMPPRISPVPRMVHLKQSVDLQLDHAFHEQQWSIAANLARQRHKSTKDEYYKALEIAAKSQGDTATDRTIGQEAIQAMVDDNTIIKDIDALDLYEFASHGLSIDYSKTIGVLRARLVKALPKDQSTGLKCLEACMWNSDWDNAQEIAVSLNKNFPADRKLLFQNIVATSLVAAAENTHENKKKLFPNLVKAQVDRAFNLRPLTGKEQVPSGQIKLSENEIKIWIQIREKFGSAQENLKLLSLPNWGPLHFLEHGFMDAFLLSIRLLALNHHWESIIQVSNAVFDHVIGMAKEEPAAAKNSNDGTQNHESPVPGQAESDKALVRNTQSDNTLKEQYIDASREWFLWTNTITAIRNMPSGQKELNLFHEKIDKLVRILTDHGRMNPVFQQNYTRILLDIAFAQIAISSGDTSKDNNKVQRLLAFSKEHIKDSYCFSMLRGYLELLSKDQIDYFVDSLDIEQSKDSEDLDLLDTLHSISFRLKAKFFQATSLTAGEECRACHHEATNGPDCEACLKSLTEQALEAFRLGAQDKLILQKSTDMTEDPLSNLAILGSICLIKLAGAGRKSWQSINASPLCEGNMQLFLQAVTWLDFCLKKNPKNDSLRMLLVKLYLMMGCVTRAIQIWNFFDVKNTLLECLGTVCLDRLASISPTHFVTSSSHIPGFAEPFVRHFETAIEKRYPDTVIKTLQNSSYAELPNVIELAQNQSRNCVVVSATIENRRAIRLKTGRNETAIDDEPLIGPLSPDFEFRDFTDYNPLPHWAGLQSTPIQELAAIGPLPTNRRCHLSILAERFLDLVFHVQPKEFKPSKNTQLLQLEWQIIASSCKTLHNNLDAFLYGEENGDNGLTSPETWYFRIISELVNLVRLVFDTVLPTPSTKATRENIISVIRRAVTILNYQTQDFLDIPDEIPAEMHTFHGIAALHATGMLRESTLASKSTIQHITMALERFKALDKSRGAVETVWITPELKKLSVAAAEADTKMKERVKTLTESLHASGWVDRLVGWAFDGEQLIHGPNGDFTGPVAQKLGLFIPSNDRETWAMEVADSWRDVMKSWSVVRFD
ncbi:N-acetyltransferase B complex non catalytic subunit-domain-containing protein [Nemania sp. FL0916]|nr:N-acetyltransferase B complex non catalytic subunit-domain-containing protein [Nemania sp. FL0916]